MNTVILRKIIIRTYIYNYRGSDSITFANYYKIRIKIAELYICFEDSEYEISYCYLFANYA